MAAAEVAPLLAELIAPGDEEVPWPTVASLLTVARFCGQRSELGIAERWYAHSAIEDLLGVDPAKINDDRLYRGLDVLATHKDQLCAHLMERYRAWFGVQFEFLLYDVTSTFFAGQAEKNEKAARGYSRDSRPDCKQVCIGLVGTPEGLPLSYEVFAGHLHDVTTVEGIVRMMEQKYGQAHRTGSWTAAWSARKTSRSCANAARATWSARPRASCGSSRPSFCKKEGWREVQSGLEAKLVAHPDGAGEEQFILCRSSARGQKEAAMLARQSDALCEELAKIDRGLAQKAQADLEAVGRRIGR